MGLIELLVSRARRRYRRRQKLFALVLGALGVGVIAPLIMVYVSPVIDEHLSFRLMAWPLNVALATLLLGVGFTFMVWAAWAQWSVGKGTPVPVVPTQKLVVVGPYRYCRNLMLFGLTLYYAGISLLANSPACLVFTALVAAVFVAYIKLVEERELELRFGEEYLRYKERTAFVIPRPRRGWR